VSARGTTWLVGLLMVASVVQSAQPVRKDPARLYRLQQTVFREAASRIAPCIVTIETIGGTPPRRGAHGRSGFIVADGPTTGLIWSSDGLVLTSSFNFVRDPSVITVTLHDDRRFVGELLARDEVRKLAMLRIEAHDLPIPKWVTEPSSIRVGQWAIALGRGFGGSDCSINVGIVSGLNRQSGLAIQTDARLSPVNYGGPLVDIAGRVLGLCVPMGTKTGEMAGIELYDSGLGFAIPYDQSAASAENLAMGHSLRRGLLGVRIDTRVRDKVIIAGVANPSPARRAGMKRADQIVAINDKLIDGALDLRRAMASRRAGQRVKVRVLRDGQEIEMEMVLAVPEDLGKIPPVETEPEDTPLSDDEPKP